MGGKEHMQRSRSSTVQVPRLAAIVAAASIVLHLVLRYGFRASPNVASAPLWAAIVLGGAPIVVTLARQLWDFQFGADFLAAISIVSATWMGELLVACIIVLMLAGGQVLEDIATRRASSVLRVLAMRMPSRARKVTPKGTEELAVTEIAIGDEVVLGAHETCPVDGTVLSGSGSMDESFLTGEPFYISKTAGSPVLSGSINGETVLFIRAAKRANDSRFAQIVRIVESAEKYPPKIRRLGDALGAFYTPLAVALAVTGWLVSGDPHRFLAVVVIATPCPLLLAIPVAIVGSISLAAKRGIVIRRPAILEQVARLRTVIFDKTGTLTYGEPELTEIVSLGETPVIDILGMSAGLEQYSRHPLARAVLRANAEQGRGLLPASDVHEPPHRGLTGYIGGKEITITGRSRLSDQQAQALPPSTAGLECVVLADGVPLALMRFQDRPREDGRPFVRHLAPFHHIQRIMLVSGDRYGEVRSFARTVGIHEVMGGVTPEQKLAIVQAETAKGPTLFVGDGVNDAPAMLAATVGVALGERSDVTAEAAGAVILEPALTKVDELLHIGLRMRRIALQSAMGGMGLSAIGMLVAVAGHLSPLHGAVAQEAIDLLAVLNALRASLAPRELIDIPLVVGPKTMLKVDPVVPVRQP